MDQIDGQLTSLYSMCWGWGPQLSLLICIRWFSLAKRSTSCRLDHQGHTARSVRQQTITHG